MSANYREPQLLLPNCKNLKLPGTGTSVGSGLTEDRHSLYSMDFDSGNSDYVSAGTSLFAGTSINSISISCWIKTTTGAANAIVSKDQATNTNRVFLLQLSNSNLFWQHIKPGSTASFQNLSTTYNVADGNWHHIVVTYKAGATSGIGEKKIYVDGEEKASDTTTTLPDIYNNASIPIEIGRRGDAVRYFNGNIDEVAIFSRALSSDEVNTLYNSGSPSNPMLLSGKPVAYYPLGEQARNPNGSSDWRFPNEVLQGQAIDFDGTDEIEIPETTLSGEFSISAWVNPDTFTAPQSMLFGGNSSNAYKIEFNGPTIINIKIAGSNTGVYSPTSWTLNKWQHLLITRNSSNLVTIYRNGVSWGTTTKSGDFIFDRISGFNNSASHFDGRLSNIAIWDTDQSANKDNIYNYGAPQTSYTVTPKLWYKLDKTSKFTGLNPNWHSALNFNGTSDRIDLSSSIDLGTKNTISAWVRNKVSQDRVLLGEDSYGSDFTIFGGYTYFLIKVLNSYMSFATSTPIIPINSDWAHIVFVRDGDNISFYINGSLIGSSSTWTGGSPGSTTTKFDTIGGKTNGAGTSNWLGEISNLAAWSQVISAEDVKYLYNGGTPQTNISFEPTSWYKLDNLTTGIQDSGSASNNGTNNGATEVASNVAVDEWVFENTVQSQTPNWSSALSFDGSSVVSINPITLDATNGMTLSLWLKCGTQSGLVFLCSSGGTGGTLSQFNFRITSDGSLLSYFNGSVNFNALLTGLATDTWNHVVVTVNYATGDVIGYKNTVQGPNTLTYGSARTTAKLSCIGAATSTGSYGMVGEISNVQVWQSVLSTNEIKTLYNNGQPQSTAYLSPISWWKLDDTANGIKDSVGSNDLTNNGATEIQTNVWTPRLNGESDTLPSTALVSSDLQFNSAYSSFSLDFNGTDHVDCTNSSVLDITGSISISCWIKSSNTGANRKIIVKDDGGSNRSFQINANHASNGPYTYFWLEGNIKGVSTGVPNQIVDGNWHHVVSVFKSGEYIRMYIDGVQAGNTNVTETTLDSANTSFIISTDGYGGTAGIDGKVDEVSVFNKALNQAEITSIYNNGYPKDITALAPVSWWRLGEDAYFNGNDFIVPNKISGAPNGTSNGMTATDLVADAPGSYAAGLGSSLALDDRIGDAPNSTANSLSFNMTPENRISYAAGYAPAQVDNIYIMNFDAATSTYINTGSTPSDLNLPYSTVTNSDFSLSFWYYFDVNENYDPIIQATSHATNGFGVWQSSTNTSSLNFWVGHYSSGSLYTSQLTAQVWYHIACVFEGGATHTQKIYVNGVQNNTASYTTSRTIHSGQNCLIGGQTFQNRYFDGKLDEFAIFDYALSAKQIKQDIYNATTSGKTADLNNNSNLTPPVAWYRMGD